MFSMRFLLELPGGSVAHCALSLICQHLCAPHLFSIFSFVFICVWLTVICSIRALLIFVWVRSSQLVSFCVASASTCAQSVLSDMSFGICFHLITALLICLHFIYVLSSLHLGLCCMCWCTAHCVVVCSRFVHLKSQPFGYRVLELLTVCSLAILL